MIREIEGNSRVLSYTTYPPKMFNEVNLIQ